MKHNVAASVTSKRFSSNLVDGEKWQI